MARLWKSRTALARCECPPPQSPSRSQAYCAVQTGYPTRAHARPFPWRLRDGLPQMIPIRGRVTARSPWGPRCTAGTSRMTQHPGLPKDEPATHSQKPSWRGRLLLSLPCMLSQGYLLHMAMHNLQHNLLPAYIAYFIQSFHLHIY